MLNKKVTYKEAIRIYKAEIEQPGSFEKDVLFEALGVFYIENDRKRHDNLGALLDKRLSINH